MILIPGYASDTGAFALRRIWSKELFWFYLPTLISGCVHRKMVDKEETEKFLKENGVRFSIAFGPVLIEDGELCELPSVYPVGEGDLGYPRAALCQMDELHYLLVMVSAEPPYEKRNGATLPVFAENLKELGCKQAYNLDGGQSATLVMNDKTVNYVWMRKISDIIYFATAIPDVG